MHKRKIKRRRQNKQRKIIITSTICLLFCLCLGYAAFQTNISITAKGNIIETYPQDGLLLHLDFENRGDVTTLWQDLSPQKTDCELKNFNNNSESGWQEDGLLFDGIDDYVLCDEINPEYITLIITAEIKGFETSADGRHIAGNWDNGGYGIKFNESNIFAEVYIQGNSNYSVSSPLAYNFNTKYFIVMSYDGSTIKLSSNDNSTVVNDVSGIIKAPQLETHFAIGANLKGEELNYNESTGELESHDPANMKVYSVLIYGRALSDDEINGIKKLEQKKYGL